MLPGNTLNSATYKLIGILKSKGIRDTQTSCINPDCELQVSFIGWYGKVFHIWVLGKNKWENGIP